MSTEFNYVVKLDTTSVMGSLAEVRSQVGMAFSGMGGGASGGMMRGLERSVGSMFGQTHTDPAMAYDPNYGQVMASTSRAQEQAVAQHGLSAAQAMRPPGVSAYEYAMGAHGNAIDRQNSARQDAKLAAQSTFYSGAAGLGAMEGGFLVGGAVGGKIGSRLATRALGAGAAGAGKMLGGLGLGIAASMAAEEYVGGRIRDHFAEVAQVSGMTNELADIVGGGRGLSRTDKYKTGVAAREAAKDINMDVQTMGDIASLGRATGLLPGTTDPGKLRSQLGDLAKAVDEGASALHTSLGNAAMVIRSAAKQGLGAEEGILRAGAAGGAEQYLANQGRMAAFGAQGGQFAMQQRLTQKQGFQMFTGALGQAAGAAGAMGPEAMQILGGRFGAARLIAAGQIGAATSPMGDMQMMAMAGGGGVGGMMDMPGQAITAMAQGGDFMSNMGKFMVHKDELRRGMGAKGIRTMARQQLTQGGAMLQQFMPGMSESEAQRLFAQNTMGMDPTQAQAYVAGVNRAPGRGGGGGGAAYARRLDTFQNMQLHRAGMSALGQFEAKGPEAFSEGYGFGMGFAVEGAMTGGMYGGLHGAAAGGAAGLVAGNLKAAWNLGKDLFGGDSPPLFASATEKADFYNLQGAQKYDAKMEAFKERYGAVDLNMDVAARIGRAPLRRTQVSMDEGMSPMAAARYGDFLGLSGVSTVEAGPGTTTYRGRSYNTQELRRATNELSKPLKYTKAAREAAYVASQSDDPAVAEARETFRAEAWRIKEGSYDIGENASAAALEHARQSSIDRMNQAAGILVGASGNPDFIARYDESGLRNREVAASVYAVAGMEGNVPNYRLQEQRDIGLTSGVSERRRQGAKMMAAYVERNYVTPDRGPTSAQRDAEYARVNRVDAGRPFGGGDFFGRMTREEYDDRFPQGYGAYLRGRIEKEGVEFLGDLGSPEALNAKRALGVRAGAGAEDIQRGVSRGAGGRGFIEDLMSDKNFQRSAFGKSGPQWDKMSSIAESMALKSGWKGDPRELIKSMREKEVTDGGMVGAVINRITGGSAEDEKAMLSKGGFLAEAKKWLGEGLDVGERPGDTPGGRAAPRAPKPLSQTIGFGTQESAMATISKSLERVHSSLTSLDKRIGAKGGEPKGGVNKSPVKTGGIE